MSVAVGLLDFYILEASEYVDQLDALVGAAVHTPPGVDAVHHGGAGASWQLDHGEAAPDGGARGFGRAGRSRPSRWIGSMDDEVRSAVVAAIDDIRILLRTVRTWGPAEEQRAAARIAELRRSCPTASPRLTRRSAVR